MILRKNKTKFRRPAHKGSLKARDGAEIRIAVPVPGEVSQFALFGDLRHREEPLSSEKTELSMAYRFTSSSAVMTG